MVKLEPVVTPTEPKLKQKFEHVYATEGREILAVPWIFYSASNIKDQYFQQDSFGSWRATRFDVRGKESRGSL